MLCEKSLSLFPRCLLKKNLLDIKTLNKEDINLILERSHYYKHLTKEGRSFAPVLENKTIANLFFEPSTRTRMSFEKAAINLGGKVINFDSSSSSVQKGETLLDTARTVESLGVEALVIRHPLAGAPSQVAGEVGTPVINAGDGCHEHPTQALLDLFTIKDIKGSLDGLKVFIVGDVLHSRVVRSNIWAFLKMGIEITVVGPYTLMPPGLEEMGIKVKPCLDEELRQADIIYLLRMQKERQQGGLFPTIKEYKKFYGITQDSLKNVKAKGIIMHPGPVVPGIEIEDILTRSPQSVIQEQVKNGVFVRMALLELMLSGEVKN